MYNIPQSHVIDMLGCYRLLALRQLAHPEALVAYEPGTRPVSEPSVHTSPSIFCVENSDLGKITFLTFDPKAKISFVDSKMTETSELCH